MNKNTKIASFEIKTLYTNILREETIDTIQTKLTQNQKNTNSNMNKKNSNATSNSTITCKQSIGMLSDTACSKSYRTVTTRRKNITTAPGPDSDRINSCSVAKDVLLWMKGQQGVMKNFNEERQNYKPDKVQFILFYSNSLYLFEIIYFINTLFI